MLNYNVVNEYMNTLCYERVVLYSIYKNAGCDIMHNQLYFFLLAQMKDMLGANFVTLNIILNGIYKHINPTEINGVRFF